MAADGDDMPDFEMGEATPPLAAAAAAPPAAAQPSAADEGLDEEDELELALEAELETSMQEGQPTVEQEAAQRDQQGAAPPAGATAQAEAARAATAAAAALQEEEEEALPLTEDGFIDLERLTAKQHQRYNTLVNEILTEAQQERYSAFRRSTLKKPIQALMSRMLGGQVPNNSKALIALASVTKSFVDDLVAAAMAVAEERGEGTPLQPAHIHEAYQRLIAADKVPGKAPRRRTFL